MALILFKDHPGMRFLRRNLCNFTIQHFIVVSVSNVVG